MSHLLFYFFQLRDFIRELLIESYIWVIDGSLVGICYNHFTKLVCLKSYSTTFTYKGYADCPFTYICEVVKVVENNQKAVEDEQKVVALTTTIMFRPG